MREETIRQAKEYAKANKFDIIRPAIEENGATYFMLDYTGRPRYTGHPHIIKISPTGKVKRVLDVETIYRIYNQAKEPLKM